MIECAYTPVAHYTLHNLKLISLLTVCELHFFFHLVSDEDGGPQQQVIRFWAGMCSISGLHSLKLGGSRRYGQLRTVET